MSIEAASQRVEEDVNEYFAYLMKELTSNRDDFLARNKRICMAEKREVQETDEKIAEKLMECEQLAAQLVTNNSSVVRASQGEVEKANQI